MHLLLHPPPHRYSRTEWHFCVLMTTQLLFSFINVSHYLYYFGYIPLGYFFMLHPDSSINYDSLQFTHVPCGLLVTEGVATDTKVCAHQWHY